ncbi:hypothetical protein Mapa_010085 [Marchantia paleacea]|nr:hypothetical protein Mapa_010085 [Marchantia paleacea]
MRLCPLEFSTGGSNNENTLATSVGTAECAVRRQMLGTDLTDATLKNIRRVLRPRRTEYTPDRIVHIFGAGKDFLQPPGAEK